MSHRQGIVSTAGLIGGISRSTANGVLSAHEAVLHDEDCAGLAQARAPSLMTRLRQLSRWTRGAPGRLCHG